MTRKPETRKQRRRRRCPSAKIAYRNLAWANVAKAEIEARGERIMTAYQCDLCHFWHLATERLISRNDPA